MKSPKAPKVVALLWTQFSPYHIDRCEAAAERLNGRAQVLACEIATASEIYAWEPSGEVSGARKVTLFPGRSYESIVWWKRLGALLRALASADVVFVGVSYAELDIVALSWLLTAAGKDVYMMTESKFDDHPRKLEMELLKPLVFAPYRGVIAGGRRQADYMRFLGYRKRPVIEGYDCVGLDRVRRQGAYPPAPDGPSFDARPFVFVARFVPKKNILTLLDAYERYVALCGPKARRLLLVGGGELEPQVRARLAGSPIEALVDLLGFLQADGVAKTLSGALALVLPSIEEQWGLVVNEALAFNLPLIVSENVGSRDALVANLVNGYVVDAGCVEGFALAMLMMGADEGNWRRMVEESKRRAPLGDASRFGEAVAQMLNITSSQVEAKRSSS